VGGRSILRWIFTLVVIVGVTSCNQRSNSAKPSSNGTTSASEPESVAQSDSDSPALPHLPETSPPPGLPIIPWGKRDHFPVIRRPQYLTAEQGDGSLARNEPVLGLIIGDQARAYSTNQLNDHEMVIDEIGGQPVLVTY
jgi:hypothetical protein